MSAAAGPDIIEDGLVLCLDAANRASYSSVGTAWNDLSNSGNNGTLTNGVGYTGPYNANGGSLIFDGTDDYISTGFTRGTLGNQTTLTSWYRYIGTLERTYSPIFGGLDPGQGTEFFIGKDSGNTNIGVQDGNYNGSFVIGSNAFDGNYHYIVYTYDNGTGKIYLDGALRNTNSFTKCNDSEQITIGGEFEGGGYYFIGNISQVSIYNRALTPAEVFQNYNATKSRFNFDQSNFGSLSNPLPNPVFAQNNNFPAGSYYFRSGSMSSPLLLEYQPSYYESRPFCCVFRSPYRSTATTNRIDLNIPMGGLLVQRDTLDLRAAVYWSTPITYNSVGGNGNNTADSGYSPRRVMLGGSGGHGIFATFQSQCNWGSATGAIGAGWDGGTCGSFPNDLVWGTGRSDTATYENRSGIWSHWITWS